MGIFYYIQTLRNTQKNRMIEMVNRRNRERNSFEYQKMIRDIQPLFSGWSTPEEYYEKFSYPEYPELSIARVIVQNTLSDWGFLLREGVVGEEFMDRLYSPWHIIRFWETFRPLLLDEREKMRNPEHMKDLEYLYDAMKKKYPEISADTRFIFQKGMDV